MLEARLGKADITNEYRKGLLTICQALFEADADGGISTDELMAAAGLTPEGVRKALHDLEGLGIASNDTAITAFVHAGVERASRRRFQQAADLEEGVINLMREGAPDQEKGEMFPLHLRNATQELKNEGHSHALPELVRGIVRSIAADGRGEGGGGGSLGLRGRDREMVQVTLQRDWGSLAKTAELRRTAAGLLLDHLLSALPRGIRGTDLLAETTMGNLLSAVKSDLVLNGQIRQPDRLMDRALLWLHEQEVVRLNKGLAVFRPAMTILLKPERRGFAQADFASLQLHYDEQVRQIHVMAEYAQHGLRPTADHLNLAMDYFSLSEEEFLERWLPDRDRELGRQTTPESWRTIVESLNNPIQRRIVADDREQTNVLVLAGPGSGKTRVLVHRIAYLVRVRRENPRGILALAYNRHAAVEIRRRLADLIGDDARGVTVLTCHALAMRLVGASFAGRANRLEQDDFHEVMRQAVALLAGTRDCRPKRRTSIGNGCWPAFRWILVDEYQDVGPEQYELIAALAGRTLSEADDRLSLFAVGDDDQNIYAFNGSSTEFIRRFEADYGARPSYLTDNYRSTANIITSANAVIEPAKLRMKEGHPIVGQPDAGAGPARRRLDPDRPGGPGTGADPAGWRHSHIPGAGGRGRVETTVRACDRLGLVDLRGGGARLEPSGPGAQPVRTGGHTGADGQRGVHRRVAPAGNAGFGGTGSGDGIPAWWPAAEIETWLAGLASNPWIELLQEAAAEYALETGGSETPVEAFIEWLAEWSREVRRRQRGLLLLTAHRAKGLEFDHVVVLDGSWDRIGRGEDADAARRLYYVAMTRARQTLALMCLPGPHPFQDALSSAPSTLLRSDPA